MKIDVENFKEKLKELIYVCEVLGDEYSCDDAEETYNTQQRLKNELIKMYEELEEKPFIKVNGFHVQDIEFKNLKIIHYNTGNGHVQKYTTLKSELKDKMLITDDFIFLKE